MRKIPKNVTQQDLTKILNRINELKDKIPNANAKLEVIKPGVPELKEKYDSILKVLANLNDPAKRSELIKKRQTIKKKLDEIEKLEKYTKSRQKELNDLQGYVAKVKDKVVKTDYDSNLSSDNPVYNAKAPHQPKSRCDYPNKLDPIYEEDEPDENKPVNSNQYSRRNSHKGSFS